MPTPADPAALLPAGALVVSCQARDDNPLRDTEVIARLAHAAVLGGAAGIRVDGAPDITAVRARTGVPIIGIEKDRRGDSEVYLTPTVASAERIVAAGADIVALDGTQRPRPAEDLPTLIRAVREDLSTPVMADVDIFENGVLAREAGADIVATTMSGYTGAGRPPAPDVPDLELVSALVAALDCPVVAEGRYWTAEAARQAIDRGAHAVVVGTAITNPTAITSRFVRGMRT